ncbi:sodium-dependent phosphate transporter [Halorhodospira halochloris]|uniref:Sodium-dependent phosphate transporter n=1 Tax=Halorhodospira halochloris TaxID=1052 RepID=A0A120N037_HALHR|nr:Na/Pi symporter [Halorhodospira halochloris]MBK1651766.1 sodium:phosphate symporter [Halorhodospira halochloris]BAU58633.1 sodium-dependent phosphate transporter [Halorhodospira halochloris]
MIDLIAGILLVIFGLNFLRRGFARAMGGDLLDWLQGFTRTRVRALAGGVAGGALMPSSTATAMLSVQMTRRGSVSWRNALAVLLGAQLGSTVLVQLVSFDLQDYDSLFFAVGAFLFLFLEARRLRGVGQSLLAFGFILLGMGLLSDAAVTLGSDPAVEALFEALAQLPLLLMIAAMLLTLLVQSATASIAVALALVAGGQISLEMLLLWVLGANIGLCLTVLIAGWADVHGRRLGLAVLMVKVPLAIALALILFTLPALQPQDWIGGMPQQAAWAHTLFNALACLAVLAVPTLERLVSALTPEPESPGRPTIARLDPLLLQNHTLAINAAMRETLRVFDSLHLTGESVMQGLRQGHLSAELAAEIDNRSREIQQVCSELTEFLDAIADDSLSPEDQALKDTLDDFMREVPMIVRTLGHEMHDQVGRLLEYDRSAVEVARPLILEAAARFTKQMNTVARMLLRERPDLGRKILTRKQEISRWLIHTKRYQPGLPYPAWEVLDGFQQLNRRLSGVVYVYCHEEMGAEEDSLMDKDG